MQSNDKAALHYTDNYYYYYLDKRSLLVVFRDINSVFHVPRNATGWPFIVVQVPGKPLDGPFMFLGGH